MGSEIMNNFVTASIKENILWLFKGLITSPTYRAIATRF